MSANKTPIAITVFLLLVAAIASAYISRFTILQLTDADLVNAHIAIAACLGAFVSATFVVFSFLQTNKAHIESHRPHLLLQIENLQARENDESGRLIPMSMIHYRNITNNRFNDLTIIVVVTAVNRRFDLSDMFRKEMTMIGLDARQRTFNPLVELRNRGLELQDVAGEGNEVQLTIDYRHTFNGEEDYVNAQSYRWDAKRQEWAIC
jgi:hypothetical protein